MATIDPPRAIRVKTSTGWANLAYQGLDGGQGPIGPQGPPGPQGSAGTGVRYMGQVPTASALPPTGNTQGDEYVTADNSHVWIWNGSAWYDNGVASFGVGPQGPAGPAGAPGPTGPTGPAGVGMPTGSGCDWYGPTAPTGFLLCDGSAVSRTTYSALYAVIGNAYGSGDGSTTFNLPDCRGRLIVGYAPGGHADVNALGLNDGAALANRRVRHGHTNGVTATPAGLTLPAHTHGAGTLTGEIHNGGYDSAGVPWFALNTQTGYPDGTGQTWQKQINGATG